MMTSRPEIYMILDKKSVKFWRPKPIILDSNIKSTYSFLIKKAFNISKMPTIIDGKIELKDIDECDNLMKNSNIKFN
jgi:hypothetical protein